MARDMLECCEPPTPPSTPAHHRFRGEQQLSNEARNEGTGGQWVGKGEGKSSCREARCGKKAVSGAVVNQGSREGRWDSLLSFDHVRAW